MKYSMAHVGINVLDLERSIDFFSRLRGHPGMPDLRLLAQE